MSNSEFTKLTSAQEATVIPSAALRIASRNSIEIDRPSTEPTLTEAYKALHSLQDQLAEKKQKGTPSVFKDNLIKHQQKTQ